MRPRLFAPFVLAVLGFTIGGCGGNSGGVGGPILAPNPPASLTLEPVESGLGIPVFVTAPPGDPRLFIVEKVGRIRIIKNGTLLTMPFLDISGLVSTGYEQGFLGLAFDPNYGINKRFYIYYTDAAGDAQLVRYVASSDPDVASTTPQPLLSIDDPDPNHNGGMLAFGPDGMLYLSIGDGGEQEDPNNRAQQTNELFGNLLRLDVRGAALAIPPDNPYPSPSRREVWCIGLRNPWRYSFDRVTGDLYLGDVGYDGREEIDVSPAPLRGRGVNFGWKVFEGTACFDPPNCSTAGLTPPVLDYPHSQGCTVIGGYVYRGSRIPSLRGTYFYADYCSGWVKSFYYSGGTISQQQDWPDLGRSNITSFGEDSAGELYICTETGEVFRIVAP